jgi:hypothetical protein
MLHYTYHLLFFHYKEPHHIVLSILRKLFLKFELQGPLLPQYCMNQYFLNLQIFFHSFAHLFPFSQLYITSSSLHPIFILYVLFISTVLNSKTFDLKER